MIPVNCQLCNPADLTRRTSLDYFLGFVMFLLIGDTTGIYRQFLFPRLEGSPW